jgi:hypothetical protein
VSLAAPSLPPHLLPCPTPFPPLWSSQSCSMSPLSFRSPLWPLASGGPLRVLVSSMCWLDITARISSPLPSSSTLGGSFFGLAVSSGLGNGGGWCWGVPGTSSSSVWALTGFSTPIVDRPRNLASHLSHSIDTFRHVSTLSPSTCTPRCNLLTSSTTFASTLPCSVVPGLAWPKSPSSGSGFTKVKPEPSLMAWQGPGPGPA